MSNTPNNAGSLSELCISPHQIPEVYDDLDVGPSVDLQRLGCVMLDVEPLEIVKHVPDGAVDLYTSTDERFPFVAGAVGELVPHVTLKYGLLKSATEWRPHIERALSGWSPEPVTVTGAGYFESPPGVAESWYCIVGRLALTQNLLEGHARLNRLPHIDMHPTYQPHITLAYIQPDPALRDKWVDSLTERLTDTRMAVKSELNYGK